ncbi:hypothetical protein G6F59_015425 [Rhizopus arrhizus]|nr:hypothetical protein G6F59_015425 [Rhizopus arrhizus]
MNTLRWHGDVRAHVHGRRHPQHLGQAQHLQQADRTPADVEFPAPHRKARRAGEGMVVVVQFLAADPKAPRRQVGGGIGRFIVAVAPPVAQAVDHAGRPERNPCHLDRPQGHAGQAEQQGGARSRRPGCRARTARCPRAGRALRGTAPRRARTPCRCRG